MKLALPTIAEFVSAIGEYDNYGVACGYSIDTRTIQPGELFFAVQGERLDGHDYVEQALRAGAVAAVVRKDAIARYTVKTDLLAVDDTLLALQRLAVAVRRLWGKKVIGITGSMGKTTTKDATAHLLSSRFSVHKSVGNFNNHFGLPLGLLKLQPEHDVAVIEMGMSHCGEIAALARIAEPEIGVVTSVAPVHLENFKSLEDIARAKYELIEALPSRGTAILNADDDYVREFGREFKGKVVRYGLKEGADVRAENVQVLGTAGSSFDVVVGGARGQAHSPLLGKHNVSNVLGALASALQCGIGLREAVQAVSNLQPADKRGQVLQLGNIAVINDCYNSSPKALMAAVDVLATMDAKRRIVVAGEMLELGPMSEELHKECGRYIACKPVDFLLGVRGYAKPMVDEALSRGLKAEFVATPEEAGEWMARETREDDLILLKASRGVKLERALERWKELRG
jgi:UDP-N-acetylmuramoyl-tripeptide--D-alanyl-D-alanine ligase